MLCICMCKYFTISSMFWSDTSLGCKLKAGDKRGHYHAENFFFTGQYVDLITLKENNTHTYTDIIMQFSKFFSAAQQEKGFHDS